MFKYIWIYYIDLSWWSQSLANTVFYLFPHNFEKLCDGVIIYVIFYGVAANITARRQCNNILIHVTVHDDNANVLSVLLVVHGRYRYYLGAYQHKYSVFGAKFRCIFGPTVGPYEQFNSSWKCFIYIN